MRKLTRDPCIVFRAAINGAIYESGFEAKRKNPNGGKKEPAEQVDSDRQLLF